MYCALVDGGRYRSRCGGSGICLVTSITDRYAGNIRFALVAAASCADSCCASVRSRLPIGKSLTMVKNYDRKKHTTWAAEAKREPRTAVLVVAVCDTACVQKPKRCNYVVKTLFSCLLGFS